MLSRAGTGAWGRAQSASWLGLGAILTVLCGAQSARAAEPWLLDVEGSAGLAVTAPQSDWFSVGGSLALTVSKPLVPWFSLLARARTAGFLDGSAPSLAGARDPGFATLNGAAAGFIARLPTLGARRSTGAWFDAAYGGGFTGTELRPYFEAGIGYGFYAGERGAIGPVLRYVQVLQPDDALNASDARLAFVGVRLSMFDARELAPSRRAVAASDRDHDDVLDASDACIDIPEDRDEFEDADGCPEPDNDKDGIGDPADGCPNMAEDFDNYLDDDGCPEDDNDGDGVLDSADMCPLEPETLNGEADQDGCPDAGLIVMKDDRIVLEERLLFDSDRARVRSASTPVLSAIVRLWKQHPEWRRVRIEGHADLRGDPAFNQELSQRRAANVRDSLIKLGIRPDVIVAEGFGSTRPLTTGTGDDDHRMNRRVEFVVLARYDDDATPAPAPAPSAEQGDTAKPAAAEGQAAEPSQGGPPAPDPAPATPETGAPTDGAEP